MLKLEYPWLKTDDTHSVKCCLCAGKYPIEEKFEFTINNKIFKIKKCVKDDLFFLSPQPGLKYAESLYNHPSYYQGIDDMYGLEISDEKSSKIAKIRFEEVRRYAPKAVSVLEIGCSYGHFLEIAVKSGFEQADGLEFSKEAVKKCQNKGLNVFLADAQNLSSEDFFNKTYDIVVGYSILEHLENPLDFLKKIKRFLSPGAILAIRVPDTNSQEGPKLSLVDHFWHFTRVSINNIFQEAGFNVKDIFESGVYKGLAHGGQMKNMTVIGISL